MNEAVGRSAFGVRRAEFDAPAMPSRVIRTPKELQVHRDTRMLRSSTSSKKKSDGQSKLPVQLMVRETSGVDVGDKQLPTVR